MKFKYRIWDEEHQNYASPAMMLTQVGETGMIDPFIGLIRHPYCDVELCLGREDEEGTPLYAGDVVEIDTDKMPLIAYLKFGEFMHHIDEDEHNCEMEIPSLGWYLQLFDTANTGNDMPCFSPNGVTMIIIGNIHTWRR